MGLASLLAESLDALLISLELRRRRPKLCNLRKMAVMIFPVRVEVCQGFTDVKNRGVYDILQQQHPVAQASTQLWLHTLGHRFSDNCCECRRLPTHSPFPHVFVSRCHWSKLSCREKPQFRAKGNQRSHSRPGIYYGGGR